MDPRHPEEAIDRIDQLITQFKYTLDNMRTAAVSSQLAKFEREGGLVVQEICLVAPRLHEAMMQVSRQRRHDLSRGFFPEVNANKLKKPTKEAIESYVEKLVEKDVNKVEKKVGIEEPDVNEISVTPVEAVALVNDLELVSTDAKISDDKTSIEIEQTYRPKKKTTRKKKTKKAE